MKKYIIIISLWIKILFLIPVNIFWAVLKALARVLKAPFDGFFHGVMKTADALFALKYDVLKGGSKC